MEPTQELVDELYLERVRRARVAPPEQKLLDCFRLAEFVQRITLDGIRNDHPGVDERRIQEFLARRFDILRQLEPSE
jgi:hypothetical protein